MIPSFSLRVSVAPDVMFRVVGDESVLLDLKSENYLGLDAMGTRMWTVLTESPSIQAAYDTLRMEYDVESDDLRHDLQEFLSRLQENELIEILPPSPPHVEKQE